MSALKALAEFSELSLDKYPNQAISNNTLIEIRKNLIGSTGITFKGEPVNFENDRWKFKDFHFSFVFNCENEELKLQLKLYIIFLMMTSNKTMSTLHTNLICLRKKIPEILERYNHISVDTISAEEIIEFLSSENLASRTFMLYIGAIRDFLRFVGMNFGLQMAASDSKLYDFYKEILHRHKAGSENLKTPDIPSEIFNVILEKFQEVMSDAGYSNNERCTAAMIIILSQTGLRISDLLSLKFDDFRVFRHPNGKESCCYIRYIPKKIENIAGSRTFHIPCNKLAYKAFLMLQALQPEKKGQSYLVSVDSKGEKKILFKNSFINRYLRLYYKVMPKEISLKENDCLGKTKYPDYRSNPQPFYIYVPSMTQFRVSYCTEVYNRGVSLEYVEQFLGHISEQMAGYYYREHQHNRDMTYEFIKEIICNNSKLLGGVQAERFSAAVYKQSLVNQKVYNNIEEIVNSVSEMYTIRAKRGGVCIKPINTSCDNNGTSQAMMCTRNICPNLYHFYFMIDETLVDAKTSWQLLLDSKKKNHINESTNELLALQHIIQKRLEPEMLELKREREIKGDEELCRIHPNLIPVLDSLEEIEKQIVEWKEFIQKTIVSNKHRKLKFKMN